MTETQNPKEEQDKSMTLQKVFNPKVIRKGIFWFITITIVAFTAIFLYTNTGKTLEVWSKMDYKYILLALIFVINDMLLGGWRNHIFVREFSPGTSQWVAFRANLANIFMGAVTPSQTGGGVAQLYIFHKNGVSLPDGITLSFINWISTLIFFPISGAMAYYIIKDRIPEGFITYLAQFGFSIFTTLFIVIIVALFFPAAIGWVIIKISKLIALINKNWKVKLERFGEKAKASMIDYRNKCTKLLSRKPQLMLYSFLLTIILYFNKYVLAYILVLAFGVEADFWTIIAIQAIVYLLLYFAPSPGGSGIAEISIAGLMAGILSDDYLASFTLLQRSFLVMIPALLGAFVVLRQLGKSATED